MGLDDLMRGGAGKGVKIANLQVSSRSDRLDLLQSQLYHAAQMIGGAWIFPKLAQVGDTDTSFPPAHTERASEYQFLRMDRIPHAC